MSRLAHPDPLLQLAQAQGTVPPPYSPPSWVSYGGGEATLLTIVLLVVADRDMVAGGVHPWRCLVCLWAAIERSLPELRRAARARSHIHDYRCAGNVLCDSLPHAALGLESLAAQRRRRH